MNGIIKFAQKIPPSKPSQTSKQAEPDDSAPVPTTVVSSTPELSGIDGSSQHSESFSRSVRKLATRLDEIMQDKPADLASSPSSTESSPSELKSLDDDWENFGKTPFSRLAQNIQPSKPISKNPLFGPSSGPLCPVCHNLRYIRLVRQNGRLNIVYDDPNSEIEPIKMPKLKLAQFMKTYFVDGTLATVGRPVEYDYGAVGIKVPAGHRPNHPPYSAYFQRAMQGCQSCSLIMDVVQSAMPEARGADVHVLAWAVYGHPLQLLVTKCTETVVSARELYLEVFTEPGKL
jgi:hypothetical protein